MEVAKVIINLLVGLVVFVTGMNMMSTGLKNSAGLAIRRLFKKIKDNRVASVAIGAGTTAIVQSSGATTVMVVGFLSAGVLTFAQGFSIMLGAFLGTTVTGLFVALSSFSFSMFLMAIAFIGFILGFFKSSTVKSIGEILVGFGILFFGLEAMKDAFNDPTIQGALIDVIDSINFPLVLFLIGIVLTAVTQSSSATNGIVIVMVSANPTFIVDGLYLVLGAMVGALLPAILASFKANILAKRVTFSTLVMRFTMSLLATILVWIFSTPLYNWLINCGLNVGLILALFTVIYNLIYILIMLPLITPIEKVSTKLIKDKDDEKKKKAIRYLDDNLIATPSVAVLLVKKEIQAMLEDSRKNFILGYDMIFSLDLSKAKELEVREERIDYVNEAISDYLIRLSPHASLRDEQKIGAYYHVINDIERIGDHGFNFYRMAKELKERDLQFSEIAKGEFQQLKEFILVMFQLADKTFMDRQMEDLQELHSLEEKIEKLKEVLSNSHFQRILNKTCHNELSPYHSTFISELVRVADHLTNVGYSIVNPTGDDNTHEGN